jgi:uncharacterized protein (TIGR03435 family)
VDQLEGAIVFRLKFLALVLLAAGPCLSAHAQTDGPSYDAATIKPSDPNQRGVSWHGDNNRVSMTNVTLRQLIKVAYGFRSDSQVVGGPEWIGKTHFDINARMDDEEFKRIDAMKPADAEKESGLLLQRLLLDRFGLKVRTETRPLPQFALVVDGVAKLTPTPAEGGDRGANLSVHNGQMTAKGVSMESLASVLSDMSDVGDRVVTDHTGLNGNYNFELNWAQDHGAGVPADATLPGLFTALKDQLGLKLDRGVGDVPVVVVEQANVPQLD